MIGEPAIKPLLDLLSFNDIANNQEVIIQESALEALNQIGDPAVGPFISRFGYKVDLPYSSRINISNIVLLWDQFAGLIRSRYSEICKALLPVMNKTALVQAAEYVPGKNGLNKMVFLNQDFSSHVWNENLSKDFAPISLGETELIVVLSKPVIHSTGRICIMSNQTSRSQRYYSMWVKIINAKSGTILFSTTIRSPSSCFETIPSAIDNYWKWWFEQSAK